MQAIIIWGSFAVIFWFLILLPQRKEQKKHREMLAALRPGDEVVTTGGLIGEIIQLKEDQLTMKTGEARVVVERARIARKVGDPPTKSALGGE